MALQVVEFVLLRRNKILQGENGSNYPSTTMTHIRFFFGQSSEDERQVPCCTFTDGEEAPSEEAEEDTSECRPCTDEERRFPRSTKSCLTLDRNIPSTTRFFFGNSAEDERQLPCCTDAEGSEDEEGSATTEETEDTEVSDNCRQCSEEEAGAGR